MAVEQEADQGQAGSTETSNSHEAVIADIEPAGNGISMQEHSSSTPEAHQQPSVTLLDNSSTDAAAELAQQLLPGLSSAAVPAVAAKMLDSGRVTLGKKLGAGAFSTVYQAQLSGSSSKWVVKRVDRVGMDQMQQLSNEIEMLTTAGNHPNLVPFRGWYRDAQGVLCLVLGHCEGGTLAALLKSRSGGSDEGLFPEDMVMCWFVQLLLALHHLHARRILHRDLKPENVLLSKNLRVAKLADFGISKQLEAGVGLAMTCLGTPHYMSPEVITHRPYTFASDMWALGVVLYEMAARRPAFDARGLPQLVVKILRNAYTPLPLGCSRPLQQLVGLLLRADPDDRPTTTDLLGLSLIRKHLQLLVGLAQGVHRSPAAAAPALTSSSIGIAGDGSATAAAAAGENSSSRSGTPTHGTRASSVTAVSAGGAASAESADAAASSPAAAAGGRARKAGVNFSQTGLEDDGEVDLGNGLSLALQDMMVALRRMAKAPLHAGGTTGSPTKRSRMAAAAAATEGGNSSSGAADAGVRRPRTSPSTDRLSALAAAGAAAGSRSISRGRGRPDDKQAAAGSSSSDFPEEPATSAMGVGSSANAAAYAALPMPLAAPSTKRQVVHTWDASAHWEAQQRKMAEMRYQAKIMEQRMAREQARQRRKELDPAAAARAAQQQQELEALQQAQLRKQQQGAPFPGADSNSSMMAAAAAAAAAQDEQLELLLEQLRAGPGSGASSSSPSPIPGFGRDAAAAAGQYDTGQGSDVDSSEIEEEEELRNITDFEFGAYDDDMTQDEDYTQALALAADDTIGDSSSSDPAAAAAGVDKTQVAAVGKRAWKLVVASLEDEAFAALLTPSKDTSAAAAAIPEDEEVLSDPVDVIDEEITPDITAEITNKKHSPAAARSSSTDVSGLPALIQSKESPTSSPRSKRGPGQQQQQQADPQLMFSQLEQQLEAALAGSDTAAAQEVISSIYRMSLSIRKPQAAGVTSDRRHSKSQQQPGDTSGTASDTAEVGGTPSDPAAEAPGPVVTQTAGLWGKRTRPKSAIEHIRDEKAGAAFQMVVNLMLGNMIPQEVVPSNSAAASATRSLNRTVTGRRVSAPEQILRRPSTAVDYSSTVGLPAPQFQQQQSLQRRITVDSAGDVGNGSSSSSRRASRSSSFLEQQQQLLQQQPRLAVIGGLTTSRPVSAAAAAGGMQPQAMPKAAAGTAAAAAAGGGGDSPGGTPRVDDALKLLKSQTMTRKATSNNSSRVESPVAGLPAGSRAVTPSSSSTSTVLPKQISGKQSSAETNSPVAGRAATPISSSRDKPMQKSPSRGSSLTAAGGSSRSSSSPARPGSSSGSKPRTGSTSSPARNAAAAAGAGSKQTAAAAAAAAAAAGGGSKSSSGSVSSSSREKAAVGARPGSSSSSATTRVAGSRCSSSSSSAGRLGSSSGNRTLPGRTTSKKAL